MLDLVLNDLRREDDSTMFILHVPSLLYEHSHSS